MKCHFTSQMHVALPRTTLRVQLVRRRPSTRQQRSRLRSANKLRPLLIDNYDSYTYNLYQIIAEVYGVAPLVLYNDSADIGHIHQLLERDEVQHIILSPGPGSPDTPADIGVCLDILRTCTNTPVLGVCLGHQALAAAAGGAVIRAPEPVHGRLSSIRHTGHRLFAGCPSGPDSGFEVVRYHSLIVDSSSLPEDLDPLAWSTGQHHPVALQHTPVDIQQQQQQAAIRQAAAQLPAPFLQQQQQQHLQQELIMSLRHKQRPHYGVQFHPESVATRYGIQVLMNFRDIAYQHTGHEVPKDLTANLLLQPAGPPGRAWSPRTWPTQQQQQQKMTTVESAGLPQTAADDHLLSSLAPAAKLSSSSSSSSRAPAGLQLSWLKLPGVVSAAGGSQQLFEQLIGPGPDTFWLDSASAPERARFSYLGGGQVSGPLACRVTYELTQTNTQAAAAAAAAPGLLTITSSKQQQQQCQTSIWDYLQHQLQHLQLLPSCAAAAATQLPFNFWGGFVGYFGYELKAECGSSSAHAAEEPDAAWLFADRAVVCDHETDDVYLLALHQPAAAAAVGTEGADSDAAAQQWLADTADVVQQLAVGVQRQAWPAGSSTGSRGQRQSPVQQLQRFRLRHDQDAYVANVLACQAALVSGESYELCLTTSYQLQQAPQPWQFYKTLRKTNPAPYAAWLNIGANSSNSSSTDGSGGLHAAGNNGRCSSSSSSSSSSVVICCSSPERFLQGGRGGVLETKPIKGTAARHLDDPAADAAAAAALISSEKERAENLMIVDLLRNDLGKVSEPGSVHVPGLIQLESYASVHQLVSTVRGLRRTDASCIDAIRAAFPGGSMTGAPKIRSMNILDDLEGAARGVYSGALGYLSVNDTFDLNIVIRTAVFKPMQQGSRVSLTGNDLNSNGSSGGSRYGNSSGSSGYVMSVGAGGAVVVQSDPAAEFVEMQLKARRLLQTAALVQQQQELISEATAEEVCEAVAS